jgi:2-polyprenyl-3-methyl-5-hydroxy-6-metoxy-1,4-benzoquinol methylase
MEVLKCDDCGLVFLREVRGDTGPEGLYSANYFESRDEYFLQTAKQNSHQTSGEHIESFRKGLRLLRPYKHGGRLLDLGCAVGVFLSLAKEEGWEVCGVDVSEYAISCAKKHCEAEVHAGELADIGFPDASFDVITMWDVVEHFDRPGETLREVHRILKEDGIILLDTPNEGSLLRKVARGIYKVSGGRISYPTRKLYHEYHRYYFTESTLRRILEAAGFAIVQMIRKPIPREKGRGSALERAIVKGFGVLERPLGMDYELLAIGRKR